MTRMTRLQARAYLARWTPVTHLEVAELRRASYEVRLGMMLACHRLARGLGVLHRREARDGETRRRWIRLKAQRVRAR